MRELGVNVTGMTLGGPEVNGVVALGLGTGFSDQGGSWWSLEVRHGVVVNVTAVGSSAPALTPTVEAIDHIGSPTEDTVLLRVAATRTTWESIADGGLVAAIDAKLVDADGDEAIFIRYTRELRDLLEVAAGTVILDLVEEISGEH